MVSAIALGAEKLNIYFTKLVHEPDSSPYTITTALNSAPCLNWFQTQWKHYPNWVAKMVFDVRSQAKES
jgi:hypothetical protein